MLTSGEFLGEPECQGLSDDWPQRRGIWLLHGRRFLHPRHSLCLCRKLWPVINWIASLKAFMPFRRSSKDVFLQMWGNHCFVWQRYWRESSTDSSARGWFPSHCPTSMRIWCSSGRRQCSCPSQTLKKVPNQFGLLIKVVGKATSGPAKPDPPNCGSKKNMH